MTPFYFSGALLACAPALAQVEDARKPLIGPFFALAEDGDLLACAIAPAPGEYTLAIDNVPVRWTTVLPAEAFSARAAAKALSENGLSLHWRVDLPKFVPGGLELRVLDSEQVPVWTHQTWELPDAGWAEPVVGTSCLGPNSETWPSGLLIASIDACDAAPTWRAAAKLRPDWMLVLDELSAVAPRDLEEARSHYRRLYREADLAHSMGTAQLFNLPSFGALEPTRDSLATLRQAYSEHHALAADDSLWSTASPGLRSGELELILVDPSELLAQNSMDAAWRRLAFSQAAFKLVMKPGRWFDERFSDRAHWDEFLAQLAFHRVFGVVLIGTDPHTSGVVEHRTKEPIGYDLLEVVCGPAAARADPPPAPPDPNFMRGSPMPAALVRVQAKVLQMRITIEGPLGRHRFPVERSSTWLRPR
jgi:hypothetical protein